MNGSSQKSCKICNLAVQGIDGIEEIKKNLTAAAVSQGETLIHEEIPQKNLFFLCSGEVIIEKLSKKTGKQIEIARIENGGLFGDMEFLTGKAPSASVVAGENCLVHILPFAKMNELLKKNNGAAREILLNMARMLAYHLSKMDEKLIEVLGTREGAGPEPLQEFSEFRQKILKEWDF